MGPSRGRIGPLSFGGQAFIGDAAGCGIRRNVLFVGDFDSFCDQVCELRLVVIEGGALCSNLLPM